MNNQNKQKNEKEMQANKVLYITVAAMLIVMATVVLLSSMLSRAKPSVDTDAPTASSSAQAPSQSTTPEETKQSSPSVTLPVAAAPDTEEEVILQKPAEPELPTFASPLSSGILSKEYSDKVLVYSTTMEDYRTHMGIDINAKLGDSVLAAADGKVSDVFYDAMMGHCIKVEHDGGLVSIYRNLSDTLAEGITVGGSVKCGTPLGYVGESAMVEIAQEPHLHFEAQLNGKHVNPADYLSTEAMSALTQDTSYEE